MIDPSAASIVRGLFPLFRIGALGVGPRVFMFRKCAAPTVGEIKGRHVKHEHGVVPVQTTTENPPQAFSETYFFGFHDLLRQHD
jgi:hypothetical protein